MFFNTRTAKRGQSSGASILIVAISATLPPAASATSIAGIFKGQPVRAAISRAKPMMLKQSARLAVKSISITTSFKPSTSLTSTPMGVSAGRMKMPSRCAGRSSLLSMPSSSALQSIPKESKPRIFTAASFIPSGLRLLGGRVLPTTATGTISFCFTF